MTPTGATSPKHDPYSPVFGLPPCLRVPIAATGIEAVVAYVGNPVETIVSRKGELQAVLIAPYESGVPNERIAKLWDDFPHELVAARLFPDWQVWVHVDYRRYREAYIRFGMPEIPAGYVLDHVQNREAIRLRFYSHPLLRLCPVSSRVNSSGGHKTGTEGMEKENLKRRLEDPSERQALFDYAHSFKVEYADPIDLTKMLNIEPETKEMQGTARLLMRMCP